MPVSDLLAEITLLLGAAAIICFAAIAPRSQQRWAALLALTVAAGLTLAQWSAPSRLTFSGVWALDGMAVAATNTLISLFYYLRVIGPMVFGAGTSRVHVLLGYWTRTPWSWPVCRC